MLDIWMIYDDSMDILDIDRPLTSIDVSRLLRQFIQET